MKNIRVSIDNKIHRFAPFTVADYRDILLARTEMEHQDKKQVLGEMLEELYPDYTPFEREHIFFTVLVNSLGKSVITVSLKCPKCGSKFRVRLNLIPAPMVSPTLKASNITFGFKRPTEPSNDSETLFRDNIETVDDGEQVYKWEDVPEYHDELIDLITYEDFRDLSKRFASVYVSQTVNHCNSPIEIEFTDFIELFELMVTPGEVMQFYKTNRALVRHDYTNQDIMAMLPVERSIALTLVNKEIEDANAKVNK